LDKSVLGANIVAHHNRIHISTAHRARRLHHAMVCTRHHPILKSKLFTALGLHSILCCSILAPVDIDTAFEFVKHCQIFYGTSSACPVFTTCIPACTNSAQCGFESRCVTSTCCGAGTCLKIAPDGNSCANAAAKMVRMLRGSIEKRVIIGYPLHLPPTGA
jgi:hypothetical protein